MKEKKEEQTADKVTAAAEVLEVILQTLTDEEATDALGRALARTKHSAVSVYIIVNAMATANAKQTIITRKKDGGFSLDFIAQDGKSLVTGKATE